MSKRRPQYIENQLQEINDILREKRVKYEDRHSNPLFTWFTMHLLAHGWYRGFNMYYDEEITCSDGITKKVNRVLAGHDYESKDYYLQIW